MPSSNLGWFLAWPQRVSSNTCTYLSWKPFTSLDPLLSLHSGRPLGFNWQGGFYRHHSLETLFGQKVGVILLFTYFLPLRDHCPLLPDAYKTHCLIALPSFFFCFCFLEPQVRHREAPSLGIELELQLPACVTATAMPHPSLVCDLHCSSQQHWIINLLGEARD